ncbi:MAG: hypothetical protein Q9173_007173, partial [Seirophora scorigena]
MTLRAVPLDTFEGPTQKLLHVITNFITCREEYGFRHRIFPGNAPRRSVRNVAEDLEVDAEVYGRASADNPPSKDEPQRTGAWRIEEIPNREEACQLLETKIVRLTLRVTDLKKHNNLELAQAEHRDYGARLAEVKDNLSNARQNRENEVSKAESELTQREGLNDHSRAELNEALSSLQSLTRLLCPHNETRLN